MNTSSPLILIADDYDGLADMLGALIFHELGYRVLLAQNGQDAVFKAIENRPDICLLDIDMPVMGGIEAARQLRQLLPVPPPLLLIAMSGAGIGAAQASGHFDHTLVKPVEIADLARLTTTFLSGR